MAEWRPLSPLASVTAYSGWRLQVFFNLQAFTPLWRPFGSSAAGSRLTIPSGSVPGDGEVDCAVQLNAVEKELALIAFSILCVRSQVQNARVYL
jgi:hypothetical protein